MLKAFQDYILKESLFERNEKILLAVSGGIDSMVMLDLFHKAKLNFAIAHCNFNLRGMESDEDENFVKNFCKEKSIRLFVKSFNTKKYSEENKISIQMAARELRYQWFEEIATANGFKYIATAHHKDDEIETFLINLTRGTGIAGLHGILLKKGMLIRPLLFSERIEIEAYAKKHKIGFKEDSSNSSVKYTRNKIRHEIIPKFEEINENFRHILSENIQRIRETEHIYRDKVAEHKNELVSVENNQVLIHINGLQYLKTSKTVLFELIAEYGFNYAQASDIINSIDQSGKKFFSQTHRIVIDREYLILDRFQKENKNISIIINESDSKIIAPVNLVIKTFENKNQSVPTNRQTAWLDKDLLEFPLHLRKWEQGDFFHPFGMKGKKLVSDFFIDEKFSIPEKENTWLLCSNKRIVWILGYRIDNRFAITSKTKTIFGITLKK